MKKTLFLFFLLLLSCREFQKKEISLFHIIPQNTFAIFQINNFEVVKRSLATNPLLKEWLNILKTSFGSINNIEKEIPKIICLSKNGKNESVITFIGSTYSLTKKDSLMFAKMSQFKYNQSIIYVDSRNRKNILYRSLIGDYQIVSNSQLALESSIRNYNNYNKKSFSKKFFKLYKSVDYSSPINIFFAYHIKNVF